MEKSFKSYEENKFQGFLAACLQHLKSYPKDELQHFWCQEIEILSAIFHPLPSSSKSHQCIMLILSLERPVIWINGIILQPSKSIQTLGYQYYTAKCSQALQMSASKGRGTAKSPKLMPVA